MPNQIHLTEEEIQDLLEYASPNSDVTHMLSALAEEHERESEEQFKIDTRRYRISIILNVISLLVAIIAAVASVIACLQ